MTNIWFIFVFCSVFHSLQVVTLPWLVYEQHLNFQFIAAVSMICLMHYRYMTHLKLNHGFCLLRHDFDIYKFIIVFYQSSNICTCNCHISYKLQTLLSSSVHLVQILIAELQK